MSPNIAKFLRRIDGQRRQHRTIRLRDAVLDLARESARRANRRSWAEWLELAIIEKAEREGLLPDRPDLDS